MEYIIYNDKLQLFSSRNHGDKLQLFSDTSFNSEISYGNGSWISLAMYNLLAKDKFISTMTNVLPLYEFNAWDNLLPKHAESRLALDNINLLSNYHDLISDTNIELNYQFSVFIAELQFPNYSMYNENLNKLFNQHSDLTGKTQLESTIYFSKYYELINVNYTGNLQIGLPLLLANWRDANAITELYKSHNYHSYNLSLISQYSAALNQSLSILKGVSLELIDGISLRSSSWDYSDYKGSLAKYHKSSYIDSLNILNANSMGFNIPISYHRQHEIFAFDAVLNNMFSNSYESNKALLSGEAIYSNGSISINNVSYNRYTNDLDIISNDNFNLYMPNLISKYYDIETNNTVLQEYYYTIDYKVDYRTIPPANYTWHDKLILIQNNVIIYEVEPSFLLHNNVRYEIKDDTTLTQNSDNGYWNCNISLVSIDDYMAIKRLDNITLVLNGNYFDLRIANKDKSVSYSESGIEYTLGLTAHSPLGFLAGENSKKITLVSDKPVLASELISQALGSYFTLDLQMVDWLVPSKAIQFVDAYPLDIIKSIAMCGDGIDKPNILYCDYLGSKIVIKPYCDIELGVQKSEPEIYIDNDTLMSIDSATGLTDAWNAVTITSDASDSEQQLEVETLEKDDSYFIIMREQAINIDYSNVIILHTGKASITPKYQGVVLEEVEQEWLVVNDGVCSLSNPPVEILEVEFYTHDLGWPEFSKGSKDISFLANNQPTDWGKFQSVIKRIKYTTRYAQWEVYHDELSTVNFDVFYKLQD